MSGSGELRATLVGLLAIPVWSTLPTLTVLAGPVPPLELVGLTFTLGSMVGLAFLGINREARLGLRALTIGTLTFGIAGLFLYHFAYFLALQNAPAVEASLVNYLWPVLIVLFSTLLPASARAGGRTIWHIMGALIAFSGAAVAISGGKSIELGGNAFGYSMAFVAALTWSSYSVAMRLFRGVPSSAVTFYCAGTAALAFGAHLAQAPLVLPSNTTQLVAIVALGLGPVGAAFYVWDYGCKHGDLRILGVAAYFAPLLSTLLLIVTGLSPAKPALLAAAALIAGGALLASREQIAAAFKKGARGVDLAES